MLLRLGVIVLVYKKYKAFMNNYGKGGYVTVFYLVSGESEEDGVKQAGLIRMRSANQSGE